MQVSTYKTLISATAVVMVIGATFVGCLHFEFQRLGRRYPVLLAEQRAAELVANYIRKYRKMPSGWLALFDHGGEAEFEDLVIVAANVNISFGQDFNYVDLHDPKRFSFIGGRDGLGDPEMRFAIPVIEAIKSVKASAPDRTAPGED